MIALDGEKALGKSYIVSNRLAHIEDPIQQKHGQNLQENYYPEDVHRILLLLILAHILMSNSAVTEGLLINNTNLSH